jgi:hypothetical protein
MSGYTEIMSQRFELFTVGAIPHNPKGYARNRSLNKRQSVKKYLNSFVSLKPRYHCDNLASRVNGGDKAPPQFRRDPIRDHSDPVSRYSEYRPYFLRVPWAGRHNYVWRAH